MSSENYDPLFPDQPVVDLYLQIWAKLPSFKSKPAFIWAEDDGGSASAAASLTYEQLNKSAQRISANLLSTLRRGGTAVVLCQPGLELVEIIFGCQRAGVAAVPIFPPNPSFQNEDFHHLFRVISQTRPEVAIAGRAYIDRVRRHVSSSSAGDNRLSRWLTNLRWIPSEDVRLQDTNLIDDSGPYKGCGPEDVYLIQYTSGTTGIPKPVLVTAGAAAHNVRAARQAYDLHPNSVIVSWLPQYHDCGLMFLLLTIVSGATSVLTSPSSFVRRPRIWPELISGYRATCTPVPSFALPLVLKRGGIINKATGTIPINMDNLKSLIIINEPIYKASVDQFVEAFKPFGLNPWAVAPSYGLAENCTFVSTAWRNRPDPDEKADYLPCYKKLLPSARLDSIEEENVEILVVDEETEEPVEDGTEGEIWISSPSNASGYLGHPSLTIEIFRATLKKRVTRKCFVRTGDRGIVIGKERYLFVTGRISDIIKLQNGRELHPHYLETAAYESYPRILRGGCLAAFMFPPGKLTVVAEVLQNYEGGERALRDLCEGVRKSLMEEEDVAVGEVVLVKNGSLPKTTSGKIRRWLAKDGRMRGKMRILMQMSFDLTLSKKLNHGTNDEEEGIRTDKSEERCEMVTHDEDSPPFSNSHHLPLISSL